MLRGFVSLGTCLLALGCSTEKPASTHTEPPWLSACYRDQDCGDSASCLCGRCTVPCQDSCASGPAASTCVNLAGCGLQSGGACVIRCTTSADCSDGRVCSAGLCTTPGTKPEAGTEGELVEGSSGSGLWARSFPPDFMNRAPSVRVGPHGELVTITSARRDPTDGRPLNLETSLSRLDPASGKVLWRNEIEEPRAFTLDASGNTWLLLESRFQQIAPDGTLAWSKAYELESPVQSVAIAADSASNVVLARAVLDNPPDTIDGPDPKGVLELQKLDASGAPLWRHSFGDNTSYIDGPFVAVDRADNVIVLVSRVDGKVDFGGGPLSGKNTCATSAALRLRV